MANVFSMRDTYGAGIADRQRETGNQFALQNSQRVARNDQTEFDNSQTEFDESRQRENTAWLAGSLEQVKQNPAGYAGFVREAKRRGIFRPEFAVPYEQVEGSIDEFLAIARAELGNVDPDEDLRTSRERNAAAYSNMSPEQQALWDRANYAPRVTDIGGVPSSVSGTQATPLSTLEAEASGATTLRQAEALGAGRGKAAASLEAEAPIKEAREATRAESAENLITVLDRAIDNASVWTTGALGNASKNIPGTPAHDLFKDLETVKANLGFDRLQRMREESKTGGALGQVAVQELVALQSTVRNLEQSQSREQFVDNLGAVRLQYERAMSAYNAAQAENVPEGVDPEDWQYLTPEERSLWTK